MKLGWAREGVFFIGTSALLAAAGWYGFGAAKGSALKWLGFGAGVLGLVLLLVGLVFFRDPDRRSKAAPDKILAPADGRVVAVEEVTEGRYFNGPARRVAIFMHLGNVHVQRMPCAGQLVWTRHLPGKYRPAFLASAAGENEQRWYAFDASGRKFALVQIAGLVARRTIAWIRPGRVYPRGERIGMIAFGSEVDTYWPLDANISVAPGAKVFAGRTVIGEWKP
jgi:phosphatidylserine decarboxylase